MADACGGSPVSSVVSYGRGVFAPAALLSLEKVRFWMLPLWCRLVVTLFTSHTCRDSQTACETDRFRVHLFSHAHYYYSRFLLSFYLVGHDPTVTHTARAPDLAQSEAHRTARRIATALRFRADETNGSTQTDDTNAPTLGGL